MQNSSSNMNEKEMDHMRTLRKTNSCMLDIITKHCKHHQNSTKIPKVDGLIKKLVQLLDENKKEDVLTLLVQSKAIAETVIERMDVKYILPILDILLARLEENPRVEHSGIDLYQWFQSIFYYHCEYMKTVQDLRTKLDFLHKLLDTRAAAYMKMQKLSGRIKLMENVTASNNESDDESSDENNRVLSETIFESSESDTN